MPKKQQSYDWLVKFLIIGDSGVGKTNILLRLCQNTFQPSHLTTIGIDFKIKTIQIEGKKIRMQIWDTAGQDRFKTITQTYYKGSMGIILGYSVTDRKSFQNVSHWMQQIEKNANQNVVKILVANKIDLPQHVTPQQGIELAKSYKIDFYQTSAKDNKNIYQIFEKMALQIKNRLSNNQLVCKNKGQVLKERKSDAKQKKGCCSK